MNIDNYRIAVIFPERKEQNIEDGTCIIYGDNETYKLHSECLVDFCKEYYQDVPVLQSLNYKHTPGVFGYFLQELGNIVFLNHTSNIKKYGKSGTLILPRLEQISEKQKASLEKLVSQLDGYDFTICYDLKIVDGILEDKELSSYAASNVTPLDILHKYYQSETQDKKTK